MGSTVTPVYGGWVLAPHEPEHEHEHAHARERLQGRKRERARARGREGGGGPSWTEETGHPTHSPQVGIGNGSCSAEALVSKLAPAPAWYGQGAWYRIAVVA